MAARILAVNVNEAKFLPFKSFNANKLKITRKRSEVQLKNGEFYPGEGHKCITIKRDNISECYFLGGSRRGEDAAWAESSKIMKMNIVSTDHDIYIESIENILSKGAMIPALNSPGLVQLEDGKLVIWGGLDLQNYCVINDLYRLMSVIERKKKMFDVTQYTANMSFGESTSKVQIHTPTARAGHSVNKIPGKTDLIMFGGFEMPNREKELAFADPFVQVCQDSHFYLLKTDMMEWIIISVPEIKPRCFHTADFISEDKLAIVGGLVYTKNSATHRIPLYDITILQVVNCQENEYLIYSAFFNMQPRYISYQLSCVMNDKLYIFGGYIQSTERIDKDHVNIVSNQLFEFDFKEHTVAETEANTEYLSCGGSLLNIDPETLLIVSGCVKNYYVYTTKPFVPEPCDLDQHGACNIKDTPEVSPIQWVQCEGGCKQWHHFFCTGLKRVPKGKYVCRFCSKKK